MLSNSRLPTLPIRYFPVLVFCAIFFVGYYYLSQPSLFSAKGFSFFVLPNAKLWVCGTTSGFHFEGGPHTWLEVIVIT